MCVCVREREREREEAMLMLHVDKVKFLFALLHFFPLSPRCGCMWWIGRSRFNSQEIKRVPIYHCVDGVSSITTDLLGKP